jgi:hypothetical protein
MVDDDGDGAVDKHLLPMVSTATAKGFLLLLIIIQVG